MSEVDKTSLAITEMSLLQAIIARHDEFKEKSKNLAVALFSAVSVGYFSGQVTLSWDQYIVASIGICGTFMILEGVYGVSEINAEKRVESIEAFLRGPVDPTRIEVYDGPRIGRSLVNSGREQSKTWGDKFKSLGQNTMSLLLSIVRWRTLFLYGVLMVLACVAALCVKPSSRVSEVDRQLRGEIAKVRDEIADMDKQINSIQDALKQAPGLKSSKPKED